jgi:Tol biopolymer transport system component
MRRMIPLIVAAVTFTAVFAVGTRVRPAHADAGVPAFVVGDVGMTEGNAGKASIAVTVDLSIPSATTVTVRYVVGGGTAGAGSDYVAASGKLTFLPGVASKKVVVKVIGDTVPEPDESVKVTLSSPVGATIADGIGEVEIRDDDGAADAVGVSIGSATILEANAGVHYVYLPLTLATPATATIKVYVYMDCTDAILGSDYSAPKTRTITFLAGERSKSLQFKVLADTTPEQIEQLIEHITVKVGAVIAAVPEGALTIVDNDGGFGSEPVGSIERVSVTSDGSEARFFDSLTCGYVAGSKPADVSTDGRYVLFWSDAYNLVSHDTNGELDLFVRDRLTGTTERVDVASDGRQASLGNGDGAISGDGRYVMFSSDSPNLVPPALAGTHPFFVRDRVADTTALVSILPDGTPTGASTMMALSRDGRHVAFAAGISQNTQRLYVRDLDTATTVDVAPIQQWADPSLSADGRFVAFVSADSTLVPGDTNNYPDLFVRDLITGSTERVNVTNGGTQEAPNPWWSTLNPTTAQLTPDGRYVVFTSYSSTLKQQNADVFVRDRLLHTTERVSTGIAAPVDKPSCFAQYGHISDDGQFVTFAQRCESTDGLWSATDLIGGYIHDRSNNATVRVDQLPDGTLSDADALHEDMRLTISGDGRYVVFSSNATNLVADDTNDMVDTFVKRVN